ncbi:MAG: hypothetical protein RLZZ385_2227 [Pseudomonadota bacterium]|jgi:predicted transcriptional regulator
MASRKTASNILNNHLGQLELAVMEVIWGTPGLDAKQILEQLLSTRSSLSLSTVQSTLERLVKKGLLSRIKYSHAFRYEATLSRPSLLARMMGDVIQLLHDGKLETILSSFVSVAERLDEASLQRLEQLIAQRKADKSEGEP